MEPLSEVLAEITAALDHVGIRYAIGGSVASSTRGVWRTTLDVDVVAAIRPTQAKDLAAALGPGWYADSEMMRSAIEAGRSFNVIHMAHSTKVDIFPATDEFHIAQLSRATKVPLGAAQIPCDVTSAEDILLAKLSWYRDGGKVSERQWNDIVGIMTTSASLDRSYLRTWAARLRVTDLLEKAQSDAESGHAP
jgi:hypothetical protein